MTSIYRTAYLRFSQNQKLKELATDYAFTKEELDYIKQNIRSDNLRLGFGVLLKVFQHLGHFPRLNEIPKVIIKQSLVIAKIIYLYFGNFMKIKDQLYLKCLIFLIYNQRRNKRMGFIWFKIFGRKQ